METCKPAHHPARYPNLPPESPVKKSVITLAVIGATTALGLSLVESTPKSNRANAAPETPSAIRAAATAPKTFTMTNSGNITGKDETTGAAISCTKGTASGQVATVPVGSTLTGFANATAVSLTSPANPNGACNGPSGLTYTMTITSYPLQISLTSMDVNTAISNGTIISPKAGGLTVQVVGSDACHATIAGPSGGGMINFTFNHRTHTVTLKGGNLQVTSVDINCDPTLINPGDNASVYGSFRLN
ncbi:hypothetical protein [Actinomadura harenae]|uniref:hypothetical protein n=1 Tax=Actinomadura harenae TaxID=2483351 RepID=UPI0011C3D8E4|nr:hypothetical protein [Actinomadura harenae]